MADKLLNADDNTCFACGPENPMGLKLEFYRDGDVVFTEPEPTKWWSSMPGVVNPGILLAVLGDTIVWSAEAFVGKTPLLDPPDRLELGDVSTREPFRSEGRLVERDGDRLSFRAEITQDGETRAVLERTGRIVTRERYEKARPLVELPASLEGRFEDG